MPPTLNPLDLDDNEYMAAMARTIRPLADAWFTAPDVRWDWCASVAGWWPDAMNTEAYEALQGFAR